MKQFNRNWFNKEVHRMANIGWTKYEATVHKGSPKPFPGKCPTRIALIAQHPSGKVLWSYFGKPSQKIFHHLFSVQDPKGGDVYRIIVEFDRNGFISNRIASDTSGSFGSDISTRWDHYHPGIYRSSNLTWLSYPYKAVDGVYQLGYRS